MLERLSRGPASVSELAKPLDVSLAAVVQHLQILEDCGLFFGSQGDATSREQGTSWLIDKLGESLPPA